MNKFNTIPHSIIQYHLFLYLGDIDFFTLILCNKTLSSFISVYHLKKKMDFVQYTRIKIRRLPIVDKLYCDTKIFLTSLCNLPPIKELILNNSQNFSYNTTYNDLFFNNISFLPQTLLKLTFFDQFNIRLKENLLPPTLEFLNFGRCFNQCLMPNTLCFKVKRYGI